MQSIPNPPHSLTTRSSAAIGVPSTQLFINKTTHSHLHPCVSAAAAPLEIMRTPHTHSHRACAPFAHQSFSMHIFAHFYLPRASARRTFVRSVRALWSKLYAAAAAARKVPFFFCRASRVRCRCRRCRVGCKLYIRARTRVRECLRQQPTRSARARVHPTTLSVDRAHVRMYTRTSRIYACHMPPHAAERARRELEE